MSTNIALSRKINKLAALVEEQKALSAQIESLKAEFKDLGAGEYDSAEHAVIVAERERSTLDTREVQKLLTPAQIAAVTKVTPYVEVKVK